jgi:hypothetical protein
MSKPYFEADKPALIELKRLSPTLRVAGANHILNIEGIISYTKS